MNDSECIVRCLCYVSMFFLSRGMQEAALYEEGHRKHSGSGGLPAWGHFYGGGTMCGHFYGALLADSN